ncbi:MAG: MMPL family transporter [Dermatophilaceae bacterium]
MADSSSRAAGVSIGGSNDSEDLVPRMVGRLVACRRVVVAGWVALLAVAALGAGGLTGQLSGGGWYVAGSQSVRALEATETGFLARGRSTITLVTRDDRHTAADPELARRATAAYTYVAGLDRLSVTSAYGWATNDGQQRAPFVGDGGRTTVTTLGLALSDGDARRELPAIQSDIDAHFAGQGLLVSLLGPAPLFGQINVLSEHGLLRAELLALPLLLGIMLWIYRGWVAAALSLLVAMTSVVWTLGVLSVVVRFVELSVFVQNAATMLGLGVAVDYSLFLISRYREQVEAGQRGAAALTCALRTAGHTVLASGVTVVLAMSTLFLIDLPVIRSLALGAVVVVSVAMVVNLVMLPALLLLTGHRVVRQRGRHRRSAAGARRWERWAAGVMRRPVVALVAGIGVLGLLALPAAQLSTFTPDARVVPPEATVRAGWDAVRADFGPGAAAPITVVVQLDRPPADDPSAAALLALPERLDALPGTTRVVSAMSLLGAAGVSDPRFGLSAQGRAALPPPLASAVAHYLSEDGRTMVIEVIPDDTASSPRVRDLLGRVRAQIDALNAQGVRVFVGGETAEGLDSNQVITAGLPLVAGTMLVVIYLLLLVTFRSVLLPLKAIAMNVASVAATYGVLVVVFQRGAGAGLLGFETSGHVTSFVPVLLLTLLFSLSTDYEVFLLSRIREEWLATGDDRVAVARGLALTAPLISGAAVLMLAVFAAFALASVLPVQELGLGMAVAVGLDATLVRLVLVPASMRLMGRWNWWHPRLGRIRWTRSGAPRRAEPTPALGVGAGRERVVNRVEVVAHCSDGG